MHLRCREFGCTVSSFQCTVSEHAWSQPEPRKELPRVVLLTVRDSAADFGLCAGFAVQALVHRRAARLAISPVWAVESLRWVEPIRSVGFKASSCMQVQTSILWQRMVSSQGYPLIEVCFLLPTHYQSRPKSHSAPHRALAQLPNYTFTRNRIVRTHASLHIASLQVLCFFGQISARHGSGSLAWFGQKTCGT